MKAKSISQMVRHPSAHWVGDGFPVRNVMSVQRDGARISPFLLLDYAGPYRFAPSDRRRGVGQHPHRGFETVTIVYQGELEHRDSAGNSGSIGPGDVQWMSAAGGVLHEEFHSRNFTRSGGLFEAVQLWVNLPAKDKMSLPRYQTLRRAEIPVVNLPKQAGHLRVIAGEYAGRHGPAQSFTPVNVWDVELVDGKQLSLTFDNGSMTAILVLRGQARFNDTETLAEAQLVQFSREGQHIEINAVEAAHLLVLNGEPINEPIASYGPFVMNSSDEISQAIQDYQAGRLGVLSEADTRLYHDKHNH